MRERKIRGGWEWGGGIASLNRVGRKTDEKEKALSRAIWGKMFQAEKARKQTIKTKTETNKLKKSENQQQVTPKEIRRRNQ